MVEVCKDALWTYANVSAEFLQCWEDTRFQNFHGIDEACSRCAVDDEESIAVPFDGGDVAIDYIHMDNVTEMMRERERRCITFGCLYRSNLS